MPRQNLIMMIPDTQSTVAVGPSAGAQRFLLPAGRAVAPLGAAAARDIDLRASYGAISRYRSLGSVGSGL
jgi:hypothetical protein